MGLFRTEFLFMERPELPSEEEQYEAYGAVARTFGARPVIIRTLDVGGDKDLPGVDQPVSRRLLDKSSVECCRATNRAILLTS